MSTMRSKEMTLVTNNVIKPIAIAFGDAHFTLKNPVCRKDNLTETITSKIQQLVDIARQYDVPLLNVGDTFDDWKCGHDLVSIVAKGFQQRKELAYVYGQHELPYHDYSEKMRSPSTAAFIMKHEAKQTPIFFSTCTVYGMSWKAKSISNIAVKVDHKPIIVLAHMMCIMGKKTNPYHTDDESLGIGNIAKQISPHVDIMITGDNHIPFQATVVTKGRKLFWLNCGPVLRTNADENNPSCWLVGWDRQSNYCADQIILFHNIDAITREHLEQKEEQEAWESQFIETLRQGNKKNIAINFKRIVQRLIETSKTDEETQRWIAKAMEMENK